MSVSSTTTKNNYSANGSTHSFAYGFKIFADADLSVVVRSSTGTETVKTLNTHYVVTNAGNDSGGNVLFKFNTGDASDAHYSGTDQRPANGETVVITRSLTLTQGTDYVANDAFPAESHEDALDRLTMITQQIQEEVDRSVKASVTNTFSSSEFTVSATDRANKVFSFDGSGDLSVTQELGTFKGNWAASTAYVVRDIVKDTSTNNIFIAITAHTSSGSQPLTTNTDSAKWSLLVDAATATTAQTAAASSASSASTSASTATTKASEASTSAATASTQAGIATAKAVLTAADVVTTNADVVSTNADVVTTNADAATTTADRAQVNTDKGVVAADKATVAADKATVATDKAAAATSASSASTSASTATTKAAEASTSASNASTSETNSASSATASASSATAAASSQTAAASSAAAAATALDSFDDRYLGVKSSDPTQDNDGNSLVSGALYFSDSLNEMRVYDGANFIAATSAGNVSLILYEYTATNGQTTFSGSDDNSATLSYTVDNLQVVMNGVILDPSDYTATNGTSVVLAAGAATGDLINIYAFKSFTTADMVSKTNGGTFAGAVGFSGGATFPDSAELVFGTGSDFKISHNGSKTKLEDTGTGNLEIRGTNIEFYSGDGGETLAKLTDDGAAELYHNNTKRIETSSTGVDVTGVITTDGMTTSADINFGDNDKAIFGAGSDLQIYHDASDSYIVDGGTGNLRIQGEDIYLMNAAGTEVKIRADDDSFVKLYFDNAEKLATTSTGVDVAGKIEADNASNPALSGVTNRNTILQLQNTDTGYVAGNATAIDFGTSLTSATASIICKNDNAGSGYGGNLIFCTSPTSGNSLTQRMVIANDGSIFTDGMSGSASAMANVKINGNNELHKDTSARINKSEIADLHIGLDAVVALTPRKFKRGENTAFEIGFIADEMALVAPEVVMRGPKSWITSVETDTEEIDISIEYDKLTALLTKAIQELKTDLDAEKAKTTTLQTQVADLITRVAALEAAE